MTQPVVYEINTRCWLRELSAQAGRPITLADIPDSEFRHWQTLGLTSIWLMGVWTGGPRARARALEIPELAQAYSQALPGWTQADVGPSPYAVADYRVSATLGGESGLQAFRQKLQSFGLKLLLDFVPNHLGLDHPWTTEYPERFVQAPGPQPDALAVGTSAGRRYLAFGRDPNCPPWTDTLQLDYRRADTRAAMLDLLLGVCSLCDGVRCDMAMLVLQDVFANTWKQYPCDRPTDGAEFWAEAIAAARRRDPGVLFLAEVYWGLEPRLQSLGFDFTYDKGLYDRLVSREPGGVQQHLLGISTDCLRAGAHFLENHDEQRIAALLSDGEHRAAALTMLGLPGLRLIHEGQLSGWRRRLPVQLIRRSAEPTNGPVRAMYDQLLTALGSAWIGQGPARLLMPKPAWEGNPTAQHFVLVQWHGTDSRFDLVVVNLAPHRSQCYAPLQMGTTSAGAWSLRDLLGAERFVRTHEELRERGLYLDLPAHGAQLFRFEPVPPH